MRSGPFILAAVLVDGHLGEAVDGASVVELAVDRIVGHDDCRAPRSVVVERLDAHAAAVAAAWQDRDVYCAVAKHGEASAPPPSVG